MAQAPKPPGLLSGVGSRLLGSLARRRAQPPSMTAPDSPPAPAPAAWTPAGQTITLEYPVRPRPRWGTRWGLPPHGPLERLKRDCDETTRGVLVRIAVHRESLRRIATHVPEGSAEPAWINDWLPALDGASLYAFVAEQNPATYLEVGSGNSTRFVRRAIRDHGLRTRIVSIDPYPRAEIDAICDEVLRHPLEDCDVAVFDRLAAGDICFVDNSHRAFQNSDVTVTFLEVLPRLAPQVLIGMHDIFLPDDYPSAWAERYYSEQYLLAAFLLGGHAGTEIVFPAWDASQREELARIVAPIWEGEAFAAVHKHGAGFWLRTRAG